MAHAKRPVPVSLGALCCRGNGNKCNCPHAELPNSLDCHTVLLLLLSPMPLAYFFRGK